ncbi:MAG: radical SAM protein [Clostridiales bacterium]|nr:MAG: radical SAM protein [Clostridiales bacterium]
MHEIKVRGLLSARGGMNLYRGCTHGCIYCDSRSSCYQFDHDFEDVAVKINAPALLEQALQSRRKGCMIGTGSMSDPYQPIERDLRLTRRCLTLIRQYGFGAAVLTKSPLILRDLDLLHSIHEKSKCIVQVTLTTWDDQLCRILEPRVAVTTQRLEILRRCKKLGIPTIVWLCPLLPFINDTEENLSRILEACAENGVAGILNFGMGVTLREGSRDYFYRQLDRLFPGLKAHYIRAFGLSYEIPSPRSDALFRYFTDFCSRHGICHNPSEIFQMLHSFPETREEQLTLF